MLNCFLSLSCIQQILSLVVATLVGFWAWKKLTTGRCTSSRRMDGKTVLITGANTGIGKATAMDLAHRGARVILACRSEDKALQTKNDIVARTGNRDVVVMQVELSSLQSVRKLAKQVLETEKRLDVLILNAGCAGLPNKILTEDGLEQQMASNHFGHFLLTNLLFGLLKQSQPARIVVVSSIAHKWSKLDLNNLNSEKNYAPGMIYHNSKLCNLLFTSYLAPTLEGTGVTINALHPGVVETEIFRTAPLWVHLLAPYLGRPFFKSAHEGAQTSIYLAVSEEVDGVSGKYFADCQETRESEKARDPALAEALWLKSEKLVNLQPNEKAC